MVVTHDVVYAKRTVREGETWLKKTTASVFYRTIQKVSRVKIPADTGDFRLMSRRAVDALCQLREQHRFMKGLFSWVGFPSSTLSVMIGVQISRATSKRGNAG